jgi:hypothetical protein
VRKVLCAAGLLLALLMPLSEHPQQLVFRKWQFSWNCQNMNEVQVAFGRWVNSVVPRDAAVLVNDAGAIRYFGNRTTIDLIGLNDHDLLFQKALGYRLRRDPREMAEFMSSRNATHLIIFPSWFPLLVSNQDFASRFRADASYRSANYTISSGEQEKMVAFRLLP